MHAQRSISNNSQNKRFTLFIVCRLQVQNQIVNGFCLQIPEVTPSASPILPSLAVLWLGSNHLTSLPEGSFSACPHLTKLCLDNNAINSLSDHTFSGLSKLEVSPVVHVEYCCSVEIQIATEHQF